METQRNRTKLFSFEFFPPKTPEGDEKLRNARRQLAQLKPAFMSCTFGAGGSTQEGTMRTILEMHREGHVAAPHISCIGSTRETIAGLLDQYREEATVRGVFVRNMLERIEQAPDEAARGTATLALRIGLAEFQNPRHAS